MIFKKCDRCGCFFTSDTNICCDCSKKDASDIAKLKNYFEEAPDSNTIHSISIDTGITIKNLNRFLQDTNFSSHVNFSSLDSTDFGNISINL